MLGKLDIIEQNGKIVTLTKVNENYSWFVSDKEYWVLDRIKWINDFKNAGYDLPEGHEERFNIGILNKENSSKFIKCLQKEGDEITQQELSDEFYLRFEISKDWWDFSELLPQLFIDFDNQIFYQEGLSETIDYKLYLPDGWKFHEDKYFENIPESLKFWVKDGIDYLKKIAEFINSNQH
ncbi:hypothetical protein ETU08_00820 [Apibacter muscae]|uniref:hypothetical protein n=1 Tax=Apibacter muscae TaxID=2509004 RepID=UPI0011AC994B|nr:hypothetical protein [Apibacter muscae]TWP31363.1 hypothetical protein ETU08_00820 [Apibacter muscae]